MLTNVLVDEACNIAKERLLLVNTLNSSRIRNYSFSQNELGSPLSPVIANLFVEEFEKKALATET